MNHQQIGQIYDSFPPEQKNMPKEQFIRQTMDALDPAKMMAEADQMARGRIQRRQIDEALGR